MKIFPPPSSSFFRYLVIHLVLFNFPFFHLGAFKFLFNDGVETFPVHIKHD